MTTVTTATRSTVTGTDASGGRDTDGRNRAVARWQGDWRCDVDTGGFSLVVDEPPSAGGGGAGPMPTDLLLASLSSCYALAVAWAARKRGVELPDLEVTATGTYEGQRFSEILVSVRSTLDEAELTPLLEPARRVCYVSNTLDRSPDMRVEVTPPEA